VLAVADLGDDAGNGAGVSVLLGNGDGSFQDPSSFAAGMSPSAVAVADFNGDNWPDLAVANFGSNDVSILLNDQDWSGGSDGPSHGSSGRVTGSVKAAASEPEALLPSKLSAADLRASHSGAEPAPTGTTTMPTPRAEMAPPPPAATSAQRAADWVFAAPVRAGETTVWPGWLLDIDGSYTTLDPPGSLLT
jgi:hypothetical protein